MKRKKVELLLEWKENYLGKPILIRGPKGVGKTYLAYDFAKNFFERLAYISIEQNSWLEAKNLELPGVLEEELCHRFQLDKQQETVLIFDEIHIIPSLFSIILNMQKEIENWSIIMISSYTFLLPISPIMDQVIYLDLSPLDFEEFLDATGNEWYIEVIKEHYQTCKAIPSIVHRELLALFDEYLRIGGMPLAINEYLIMETMINVPNQHDSIWYNLLSCFRTEEQTSDYIKNSAILDSIVPQLSKNNKTFQYTKIKKGATRKQYENSINQLVQDGYLIKSDRFKDDSIAEKNAFKLYFFDPGVLLTKASHYTKELDKTDPYFVKGLLENYIAFQLNVNGYNLTYWESKSAAKLDFVIQKGDDLIPIEARIDGHTRSKNINIFLRTHAYPYAIKISTNNFKSKNDVKFIPLYATFCI